LKEDKNKTNLNKFLGLFDAMSNGSFTIKESCKDKNMVFVSDFGGNWLNNVSFLSSLNSASDGLIEAFKKANVSFSMLVIEDKSTVDIPEVFNKISRETWWNIIYSAKNGSSLKESFEHIYDKYSFETKDQKNNIYWSKIKIPGKNGEPDIDFSVPVNRP